MARLGKGFAEVVKKGVLGVLGEVG
jgi:hypothetical protein